MGASPGRTNMGTSPGVLLDSGQSFPSRTAANHLRPAIRRVSLRVPYCTPPSSPDDHRLDSTSSWSLKGPVALNITQQLCTET